MTELIAASPEQLQTAQRGLLAWAESTLVHLRKEVTSAQECLDQARRCKWRLSPFKRFLKRWEDQVTFVEKVESALHAGYLVIPAMPLTVFAVRTDEEAVGFGQEIRPYNRRNDVWVPDQEAPRLSEGEGENVSPRPVLARSKRAYTDTEGKTQFRLTAQAIAHNPVSFPLDLAKPVLMTKAQEALALKVFDEVGVARDELRPRRGDPYLVGRILNPNPNRPDACFFIGWAFEPNSWLT